MTDVSTINGVDVSELGKLANIADQLRADRIANEVRAPAERVSEGRRLLQTNASRVQHDVEQRIVESRRRLELRIREALLDVRTVSEEALNQAHALRNRGQHATDDRLRSLSESETLLRST